MIALRGAKNPCTRGPEPETKERKEKKQKQKKKKKIGKIEPTIEVGSQHKVVKISQQ